VLANKAIRQAFPWKALISEAFYLTFTLNNVKNSSSINKQEKDLRS